MLEIPKQKQSLIPLVGLGTWRLVGSECDHIIKQALDIGYTHIDTADLYQNHKIIGNAIRSWSRDKLFLTTKIAMDQLEPAQIETAIPRFLEELQTDYIDLLLIHWPNPRVDLAKALITMLSFKTQGVVRAIGVSNFVRFHFEQLAPLQLPIATNQIELHPYLQRRELLACCKKFNIPITAHRPLAKGAFENDPILINIGKKYGKSASQIALRWLVQQDFVVIPKAAKAQHLQDNLAIFDFALDEVDMQTIHHLEQGTRFCNPDGFPVFND